VHYHGSVLQLIGAILHLLDWVWGCVADKILNVDEQGDGTAWGQGNVER
jgi:hypothetical protein